jgi:hypothetical protein
MPRKLSHSVCFPTGDRPLPIDSRVCRNPPRLVFANSSKTLTGYWGESRCSASTAASAFGPTLIAPPKGRSMPTMTSTSEKIIIARHRRGPTINREIPTINREIVCLSCDGPLYVREGQFLLKYFLIERVQDGVREADAIPPSKRESNETSGLSPFTLTASNYRESFVGTRKEQSHRLIARTTSYVAPQ